MVKNPQQNKTNFVREKKTKKHQAFFFWGTYINKKANEFKKLKREQKMIRSQKLKHKKEPIYFEGGNLKPV